MIDIKAIWENHKPTGDIIIKTRIAEISHLNCFAATNHITGQHLYIMSVSKKVIIPELKSYRFKGVEIYMLPNESGKTNDFYVYLLDNDLKDIFSLFIQNILEDVIESITESEALNQTLNVVSKWKRLFDKINFNGLNLEQQKGLIGELLFFDLFLKHKRPISTILSAWTGPDFEDKDFIFGLNGVEIKLTSSKYPKIKITNERQLDNENLNELFLILYITEEVKENGFTLSSLVEQTRKQVATNLDALKYFNERLILLGYFDTDKEHYQKMYSVKNTLSFSVAPEFPKIIKSQLPIGIYNTSYSIELSAVEQFQIPLKEIMNKI